MFISVLDLFKIGVGPSSSHTMGPMVAAKDFRDRISTHLQNSHSEALPESPYRVRCILKGSLAFTGKGHGSDRAIVLGLHGYTPKGLATQDVDALIQQLWHGTTINFEFEPKSAQNSSVQFSPQQDILFDTGPPLAEHPNGMIFQLFDQADAVVLTETYFSIGGGFVDTMAEIKTLAAPVKTEPMDTCPFPFDSAQSMLDMSRASGLSTAAMKRANEHIHRSDEVLDQGLDEIWNAMKACVENGLMTEGTLPGGLQIKRRAKSLHQHLHETPQTVTLNDWMCAYAMAVNEENAAGHMVVTAPTNGAAGVVPAILYYFVHHMLLPHPLEQRLSAYRDHWLEADTSSHPKQGTLTQNDLKLDLLQQSIRKYTREFLLTAAAIGGIIKHRSSISGAEIGCQGEVGSAAAMAAAGLCAVLGGSVEQVENAAEIALEHHLGMTCDPVGGLVQVPCIERNGFGAIKAYTAASLALRGTGEHFMPLDNCIAAMKQTGQEMSHKFKETSLGGLAVSLTEC